jgi:hypothetical protein
MIGMMGASLIWRVLAPHPQANAHSMNASAIRIEQRSAQAVGARRSLRVSHPAVIAGVRTHQTETASPTSNDEGTITSPDFSLIQSASEPQQ